MPAQRRAANGTVTEFDTEITWEDAATEESDYVRVSDVTVLRVSPMHTARVKDLTELRHNVSSRQHKHRAMQQHVAEEVVGAKKQPSTRERMIRPGPSSKLCRSTDLGASGRVKPKGLPDSAPCP